jgi:hypothetical protein
MVDISTIQTIKDLATRILLQTGDVSGEYKVYVPLLATHPDMEILLGTSICK